MKYYVNASAFRSGCGTKEAPFKNISSAAKIAKPGDEVLVAPGIYREYVDPANAGTEDARITYTSAEKGGAVITGAEEVKNWTPYAENVWMCRIQNGIFGQYNPYTTPVAGDWYFAPKPVHTGEIYLNGHAMYEVLSEEEVLNPTVFKSSWEPEATLRKWYTAQDDEKNETILIANFGTLDPNAECVEINVRRNCFYPSREGVGYITVSGFVIRQAATQWAPPTAYQDGMIGPHWSKGWIIEDCEISDSRCSGISLGKYLQPSNNNKWSTFGIKDGTQTERDNICLAQYEGWTKERIGSHIIRRCNIHHCGQTGIVGHLGGVFSLIEDNHIHHINNKQDLNGAEIGGIKMHAAIDVVIRRNHFHHCTRGLWLDWQAQGTRVSQNLFHDNTPPAGCDIPDCLGLGEDIFLEVSHGPTLFDNNLLLSKCAGRLSTQGFAFVHNLIAGSFTYVGGGVDNNGVSLPTPRYTPYHMPHRTEVAGFMSILHGDARFLNNIFVQMPVDEEYVSYAARHNTLKPANYQFTVGTAPFGDYPSAGEYYSHFTPGQLRDPESGSDKYYSPLPVWFKDNFYFNGAKPCSSESDARIDGAHNIFIEIVENTADGRPVLRTNLYDYLPAGTAGVISTAVLGKAFESEQPFENPDGSEIIFNEDYFGNHRAINPTAGPIEQPSASGEMVVF